MGGPRGPRPSGPPGRIQSKLPISDPQSKTAKRSRALLKQHKRLRTKTRESAAAVQSLRNEEEGWGQRTRVSLSHASLWLPQSGPPLAAASAGREDWRLHSVYSVCLRFLEAEGLEHTYKFTQAEILENVSPAAKQKAFNLDLSFGPYSVDYTRGGRELLLGGQRGSMVVLDCQSLKALCELNVKETVRDVKFLQNHTFWAAAQKKYVYIYDNQGIEIHCLRDLMMTYCLDFLPYHYLMVSVGEFGQLVYYDISTGHIAGKHNTRRGPCSVMRQNPRNAVMHLGHTRGTVTLWTPNMSKPAVEMFCHKGRVSALTVEDTYLITAGVDGKWKLWDLRKYETVQSFNYFGAPPSTADISQTGLVALGFGSHVQVWKDVFTHNKATLYMTHEAPGEQVSCLRFRPFEDVCAVGTSGGVSGLIVPGSGLANYDSLEANPYETKKQRQEREIHSLLEKLPADMISLDPKPIGAFDQTRRAAPPPEETANVKKVKKPKKKQRGRDTPEKRSQKNEREQLIKKRHMTALRLAAAGSKKQQQPTQAKGSEVTGALSRFVKK
ncbi:hypothetical protein ACSSS7_006982 [Eimeria intestinalis]